MMPCPPQKEFYNMEVAIVKYNAGNVESVQNALNRLGVKSVVTDDHDVLRSADRVIFPGVGHAQPAMEYLIGRQLDRLIISLVQPVLGICLGMQLMCNSSEEANTKCLGIFDTEVKLFNSESLKVPQVGWNDISHLKTNLFRGLQENSYVYYVHSYYVTLAADTIAQTSYILPYTASLGKDNFYGVQFHPEKSGSTGEKILANFLEQ